MALSPVRRALAVALTLTLLAGTASAAIVPYSQDFEALGQADPNALANDGWFVGANVFDPTGANFLYNYFAFPAPNGGPAFSVVSDVPTGGSPPVGNQGLVVYNDYNNGDHNIGNRIEAIFFRDQTISAADVGKTATFSFVAAPDNLGGASTAQAFIKTLDPNNGFATTNLVSQDTTTLPAGNSSFSLNLAIDNSLVGQIFQIGFQSTASNFDPSGVNYDNINVTIPEPGTLAMCGLGLAGLALRRRRS